MENGMETDDQTPESVATFWDHVHLYLTGTDFLALQNGWTLVLPLAKHPMFSSITLKTDPEATSRLERGVTNIENNTFSLSIPPGLLDTAKSEINIETGDHRNFIIRREDWKNEMSDWQFLTESIRQKISETHNSSHVRN